MTALQGVLLAALPRDADAFRAYLANRNCLALNRELFADTGFVDRIVELAAHAEPPRPPGPDRDQLLALLDATPATA